MWYGKQLRHLRRARRELKRQQHQLLELELEGLVAITLHSLTSQLTVAMGHEIIMQAVDLLQEGLRDRRRQFKTEVRQLRQDWSETDQLRARPTRRPGAAPVTLPQPD